jgi:hypothetical protein
MTRKKEIYTDLELTEVMSSSEVTAVFGLSQSTVRNACKRGTIPCRKSGNVWIMKRVDAMRVWGQVKDSTGNIIDLSVNLRW